MNNDHVQVLLVKGSRNWVTLINLWGWGFFGGGGEKRDILTCEFTNLLLELEPASHATSSQQVLDYMTGGFPNPADSVSAPDGLIQHCLWSSLQLSGCLFSVLSQSPPAVFSQLENGLKHHLEDIKSAFTGHLLQIRKCERRDFGISLIKRQR